MLLEGLEEKAALELIKRHAKTFEIKFILSKPPSELLPLVRNTGGNPQAIVLSLGILRGGAMNFEEIVRALQAKFINKNINTVIDYLFSEAWKHITQVKRI